WLEELVLALQSQSTRGTRARRVRGAVALAVCASASSEHRRCRFAKQFPLRARDEGPSEKSDRQRQLWRRAGCHWRKPVQERRFRIVSEFVHLRDAMHTPYGAQGRAILALVKFPLKIASVVLLERDSGMATLLRAPVDDAVFAHVEVPSAGAAVRLVRLARREVLLEAVVVGEVEHGFPEACHPLQHRLLHPVKRTQSSAPVVDKADGRGKPQLARPLCNRQ